MDYTERNLLLYNGTFTAQCRMALCDWVNYWAVNGVDEIEDETLRDLTSEFLILSLENIESYVNKLTVLVISEPNIIDKEETSDADIRTAVNHVMSTALKYLI